MKNRNFIKDALLGVAIGDALGVPVEFVSRKKRDMDPVTGMREKGTHNQTAGTWSDDTSLTLCLAEMLCRPYDLKRLAGYFVNWKEYGYYTAGGHVFDIGIATSTAIQKLASGVEPTLSGGADEFSNGNGSLMRILPLVFFMKDLPVDHRFEYTKEVSSLTHGHIRSVVACFIYLEYARLLVEGYEKTTAYQEMTKSALAFLTADRCPPAELQKFDRILQQRPADDKLVHLKELSVDEIHSSGYVVHTLEASFWCILRTNNFSRAVLQAVNLGDDTDTTGAVTGGLAGLLYGADQMPNAWLDVLAKRREIEDLAERLYRYL